MNLYFSLNVGHSTVIHLIIFITTILQKIANSKE